MKETIVDLMGYTISVQGIVQGIGFRPFVYQLARSLNVSGYVFNDSQGVMIYLEGSPKACQTFMERMVQDLPKTGRIDTMTVIETDVKGVESFHIRSSTETKGNAFIGADIAPCDACLQDILDPANRRFHYGFTNCTNCGPRYTIIEGTPYDRSYTSMKSFPMCSLCHDEYENIDNRRYHAEPNACPTCGPTYTLLSMGGESLHTGEKALQRARELIEEGYIVAIKGVGGYHLVCDALQEDSIQRLRVRKQRLLKPLAVMARSLEVAKQYVNLSPYEEEFLMSSARPIVVAQRKEGSPLPENIAPHMHTLGVMLPYAPYHYSVMGEKSLWVMTSANRSGDPVLYEDEKAFHELQGIADYLLVHNRRIISPVDDSVGTIVEGKKIFYRRSRGYVPLSIQVKALQQSSSMLAMGADMKAAFAMSRHEHCLMGPHLGDMERQSVYTLLEETIERYKRLFSLDPQLVVVDAHPKYYTSQFGKDYATNYGIPYIEVQHHHSHVSAVQAEYNMEEPVLGICFDGTGYGLDGHIWGGEFLLCEGPHMKRLGHLSYTPLPSGDASVKEPWRQALWYVDHIYGKAWPSSMQAWAKGLPPQWELLQTMFSHMTMPLTSSGGRLFDVVSTLLGLGYVHGYDAHLAIALEQLGMKGKGQLLSMKEDETTLDSVSLVYEVVEMLQKGYDPAHVAASFQKTLVYAISHKAHQLCQEKGIRNIALCGGVFQNRYMVEAICHHLKQYDVYIPSQVPLNDGGIALGQLWLGSFYK